MESELRPRQLIVGLGNPGNQYRSNRHNVGFMVADHIANRLDLRFSRLEFKALVTKGIYQGIPIILAKPQTYMNLSGKSVKSLTSYYKIIPKNLLVVYDDVDLSIGTIRIRPSGGSAGQKGIASIINSLGSQDFPRLRLGIDRPPGRMDASAYVLRDFSKDQLEYLHITLERATDAVLVYLIDGLDRAMNEFNGTI